MILHAEGMKKRKDIGELRAVADGKLLVAQDGVAHVRPKLFRLGAVKPEGVPSLRKQFAGQPVPINVARLRAAGIIDMSAGDKDVLCESSIL